MAGGHGDVIVAVADSHVYGRAFAPHWVRRRSTRSSICHQQRAPDEPIAVERGHPRAVSQRDRGHPDQSSHRGGCAMRPRRGAVEDVLGGSQLAVRQMLVDIQTSERPVKVPGNPVKLSDVKTPAAAAPPALGEHTEDVRRALADKRSSGS